MTSEDQTAKEAEFEIKVAEQRDGVSYMWHLESIGLWDPKLSISNAKKKSVGFDVFSKGLEKNSYRSRVAIIDNGVAARHSALFEPNGTTSADGRVARESRVVDAMDFSYSNTGAVYGNDARSTFSGLFSKDGEPKRNYEDDLRELLESNDIKGVSPELEDVLKRLDASGDAEIKSVLLSADLDPSARFAAHGTACAGLVGANTLGRETSDEINIPYIGLNPLCQIIPITTTYDYRYWPIILSLLYALAVNAHVILLPRAIEDMPDDEPDCDDDGYVQASRDPRRTRIDEDEARRRDYLLLRKLIAIVSRHRPLIVPAGNSGMKRLEFPASMVLETEMNAAPDLIVVGAVTALGRRASYSNRPSDDTHDLETLIYAPSDDREVVSEDLYRLDTYKWRGRHIMEENPDLPNSYSPYGVLTLDVPGRYGYNAERGDAYDFQSRQHTKAFEHLQEFQNHSEFTLFGGTSAASAIVAGFVSLWHQVVMAFPDKDNPLDGTDPPRDGRMTRADLWKYFRGESVALHMPLGRVDAATVGSDSEGNPVLPDDYGPLVRNALKLKYDPYDTRGGFPKT